MSKIIQIAVSGGSDSAAVLYALREDGTVWRSPLESPKDRIIMVQWRLITPPPRDAA